jgi:hypothetical protein
MLRRLPWIAGLALAAGCPAGDECALVEATCTPAYEPTFANVFDRTLVTSCGVEGSSCHSIDGRKAGLVFDEIDEAYDLLLDGRVEPGDAGCSEVVRRIESTSSGFKMPPGSRRLSEGEKCAIEQWIAAGAAR